MKGLHISLDVRPYSASEPITPHCGRRHPRYLTAFQSQVKRYRNSRRTVALMIVVFILGCAVFSETGIGQTVGVWGLMLLVALWIAGLGLALFGLRLTCPGCRKRLEPAKGRYCPQCGSDQFDRGKHVRNTAQSRIAYCPACDGTIRDENEDQPRTYLIRGCTHCGVLLDEKGV